MRRFARGFFITLAGPAAGSALAHSGHPTVGALAGAAHLHATDIALVLLAVAAAALLAPGARQAGLRALAASGRVRVLAACAAAAVAVLALLLA